ncbi:26730_t:CDS:2, partial [Dentiscutata erythropus]
MLRFLDKKTLVKRSKFKSVVKNLPKIAAESALLRQLKNIKAKAVYISTNSNRNQKGTALVYFASKEDQLKSMEQTVYYFNTKLEWADLVNEEIKKSYQQPREKSSILKSRNASISYLIDKENITPKKMTTDSLKKKE